MRIVSREELSVFKPTTNTVLLRNILPTNETGKSKLYIAGNFHPEYHQSVVNEVVSVPKFLTYGRKKIFNEMELYWDAKADGGIGHYRTEQVACHRTIGMPWLTKMEVKRGDVVWVSAQTMKTLNEHGDYLLCEGEKYFIFPYHNIYLKKEGDDICMLNGWVLIEPIIEKSDTEEQAERIGLIYQDKSREHYEAPKDNRGIVRYMGLPITEYEDGEAAGVDDPDIPIDSVVIMKWGINRRLEHEYHSLFSKPYIVSRRRNICAIIQTRLYN